MMSRQQHSTLRLALWILLFVSITDVMAFLHPLPTRSIGFPTGVHQQKSIIRNGDISNSCQNRKAMSIGSAYPLSRVTRQKICRLYSRPQDNLVSGIAEIGIGFALGVLWSESFIALTGCGPPNFSDTLERICYQGVIVLAGVALFNRIVTGGKGLDTSAEEAFGPLESFTLIQVQIAEYAGTLAVVGAFVALGFQFSRGANMDGLSGIDVAMCRAIRDM